MPPEPPELSDVYDDATLAAIESWPNRRGEPARGPRAAFSGAVLAAGLVGARVALEDEADPEPVVEVRPTRGGGPLQGVEVLFVPGDPAATVAVVRPWLLPRSWLGPATGGGPVSRPS